MKPPNSDRAAILVTGFPYWTKVATTMLRDSGFNAAAWHFDMESLPSLFSRYRPLRQFARIMSPEFRSAKAIHTVEPLSAIPLARIAKFAGKRVFFHWVGTDVQTLTNINTSDQGRMARRYSRAAHAHFADSPDIIEELRNMGIDSELFRLLPNTIIPQKIPLPDQPAVLCYWSKTRRDFGRVHIIDSLADEFPSVTFLIVGTDGVGEPQHSNMTYLGFQEDIEEVYRRTTIFLRLVVHDSLSAMVLEALARGRWVIYSKQFPHCDFADDLEKARSALVRCLSEPKPNDAGRGYIQANFLPQTESHRIAEPYARALSSKANTCRV